MCEPTYTLLRWPHHDWPSNTLSLADQVLDKSFSDMDQNSISALYADFRSPSRAAQRDLRKRRRMLNPMFRSKHCAYHRDCLLYAKPHLLSRRRRWRGVSAECTSEAYRDRECAELAHREMTECADVVALYYNHGHNASVIERLLPRRLAGERSEEGEVEGEEDAWAVVPSCTADGVAGADVGVEAELEGEADADLEAVAAQNWTIYLYHATSPRIPSRSARSPDIGRCARDETTFTFHRNASGLWELGYANQYLTSPSDPSGCTQNPLPVSCGCCSFNQGVNPCSCASFGPEWRSPEEHWRGSLRDWMSWDVARRMERADMLHAVKQRGFTFSWRGLARPETKQEKAEKSIVQQDSWCDWTFVRFPRCQASPKQDDWDIVSELSSTGSWRVIDMT